MICENKRAKFWWCQAVALQPPPQIEQIGRKRDEKMNNTRKGLLVLGGRNHYRRLNIVVRSPKSERNSCRLRGKVPRVIQRVLRQHLSSLFFSTFLCPLIIVRVNQNISREQQL